MSHFSCLFLSSIFAIVLILSMSYMLWRCDDTRYLSEGDSELSMSYMLWRCDDTRYSSEGESEDIGVKDTRYSSEGESEDIGVEEDDMAEYHYP